MQPLNMTDPLPTVFLFHEPSDILFRD